MVDLLGHDGPRLWGVELPRRFVQPNADGGGQIERAHVRLIHWNLHYQSAPAEDVFIRLHATSSVSVVVQLAAPALARCAPIASAHGATCCRLP